MNGINEELKLVNAAKEGDNFAMRKLYEQNYSSVFRLAGRYAGNREDAEDIVQDVFIKAFNSLNKFSYKKGGSFGGWIYRICINLSINFIKRKKKISGAGQESHWEPVAHENSPDEKYRSNEVYRKVEEALNSLSPKQKMMFVLKHYEGLKIDEIAAKMECSSGSVKKQLFRATDKLRQRLDRDQLIGGKVG